MPHELIVDETYIFQRNCAVFKNISEFKMTSFVAKKRFICLVSSVALIGAAGAARFADAQGQQRGAQTAAANPAGSLGDGQLHLLPVQGNISLLVGAGAN